MKAIPLIRRGEDGLETTTLRVDISSYARHYDYKIGDDYYQPLDAYSEETAVYKALILASAEGWREDTHSKARKVTK